MPSAVHRADGRGITGRVHQVVVVAASAGFRSSTPEFAGSKGDCRRGVRRLMCSQRDGETERAEVAETH